MCPLWRGKIDNLPRVHPVLRIEGCFDRAHDFERLPVFIIQIFHLSVTDAMLAGAGAAHGQSALHGLLRKAVRFLKLRWVVGIENA